MSGRQAETPHDANRAAPPGSSRARVAALVAVGLTAALFATTKITITGGWYGVYLLERPTGRPFALKDDLRLGDGPNLIAGLSFSGLRALVAAPPDPRAASLDLDWSEAEGGGLVRNALGDGSELVTLLGRNLDDEDKDLRGLFVGGALPDVAAVPEQNQSGMALRDARGWHHVWCNVNETLYDDATGTYHRPGQWKFLGSQVVIDAPDRVVLESDHEIALAAGTLRVERFAYFKAGRPFMRLGINLMNVGDAPVRISYAYGDEPWVGDFGSAKGNLGWTASGIVPTVAMLDPAVERFAGIVDVDSGVANFLAWDGSARPDRAFFGNRPGTPRREELGRLLASNEVFIGLEWLARTLGPGELLSIQLTVGLAPVGPQGPRLPEAALTPR